MRFRIILLCAYVCLVPLMPKIFCTGYETQEFSIKSKQLDRLPVISSARLGLRRRFGDNEFIRLQYTMSLVSSQKPQQVSTWIAIDRLSYENVARFVLETNYNGGEDFLISIRLWNDKYNMKDQAHELSAEDGEAIVSWLNQSTTKSGYSVRLPTLSDYMALNHALREELEFIGLDPEAHPSKWEDKVGSDSIHQMTYHLYDHGWEWTSSQPSIAAMSLINVEVEDDIAQYRFVFSRDIIQMHMISASIMNDSYHGGCIRLAVDTEE